MTDRLGPYLLGPNDTPENGIYTGDARELAKAIPDASVDLIFTDPVYDRIEDYRWLAETAARVLRLTGAVLVWSNGKWHHRNTCWLEDGGLCWRYTFANVMVGGPQPMCGKIIAKSNRVLWLDRNNDSRMAKYLADGLITTNRNDLAKGFKWSKSPRMTADAMRCFLGIVLDPFVGGGTVPAVCKMLGRRYLAFEIDPDTAELARERVRNTQPPLFVPEPVQQEMRLDDGTRGDQCET